jgi:transposase
VIQHGERGRFLMAAAIGLREDHVGDDLRRLARVSRDGRQVRRLLALAAIYDGASRTEAARIGGVTLQIVRDWVVRFNAEGPAGLLDRKAPGKAPSLGPEARAALARVVEDGPAPWRDGVVRWRLIDLVQWLWESFGVSVSETTVGRELRAMGFRKLSARVLVLVAQSTTCQLLRVAPATHCRVSGFPVRAKTAPLVQPVSSISDSFATQRVCRNPIWLPRKISNEIRADGRPTKSPKVNRPREYRPGENGFQLYRHGRSGEPRRYNPRKQQEISVEGMGGERVCGTRWRRGRDWEPTFSGL